MYKIYKVCLLIFNKAIFNWNRGKTKCFISYQRMICKLRKILDVDIAGSTILIPDIKLSKFSKLSL